MIESLAERFTESRHRWLIVTGVTFVIALASCLPQVDQLVAERSERAELLEQLAQAEQVAGRLPSYEKRVAEKTEELNRLRLREVDEAQLAKLRSWLVSAARQAGCQVRRIDLSPPVTRSWTDDDNPITTPEGSQKNLKTPFRLETRNISFSVTGATSEVLALLKTLDEDARLKHAHSVDLKPAARNASELQLDLTLWYFALVRPPSVA